MIKFISSFIPKPFARVSVGNARCIVRVHDVPSILCNEPEGATLDLVWMSERRFNRLSEAIGF